MRHGRIKAVLAGLVLTGCAYSGPLEDMVGYVPPTSLPAQPKRMLIAEPREKVWNELLNFFEASAFEINHVDEQRSLLVARYSGNPEPYIDCGSIVTHQNGTLGQIGGAASIVTLNYQLEDKPVILNRALNLDSRIIVRLADQPRGTVVQTDITYVVTKTVDVEYPSGKIEEGQRETVSFDAGDRAEFSKGTTCQPNGALDVAVLQTLPSVIGSDDTDSAALSSEELRDIARAIQNDQPTGTPRSPASSTRRPGLGHLDLRQTEMSTADDLSELDAAVAVPGLDAEALAAQDDYDWVLPEQGLPMAALPAPKRPAINEPTLVEKQELDKPQAEMEQGEPLVAQNETSPEREIEEALTTDDPQTIASLPAEVADTTDNPAVSGSASSIVDDTTRKLLSSLDCSGDEWHFCDLVEVTTPYRKRNIEELYGFTVNTTESFASQIVGDDLKLDVLFPTFPSYLHIAYARRDGIVRQIASSPDVWPAYLSHQLAADGQKIPGPAGLAMIIAIATDEPLFDAPSEAEEDAAIYLERLKDRLADLEKDASSGSIAASQLLLYVEDANP